jgi:hypothetical protein
MNAVSDFEIATRRVPQAKYQDYIFVHAHLVNNLPVHEKQLSIASSADFFQYAPELRKVCKHTNPPIESLPDPPGGIRVSLL